MGETCCGFHAALFHLLASNQPPLSQLRKGASGHNVNPPVTPLPPSLAFCPPDPARTAQDLHAEWSPRPRFILRWFREGFLGWSTSACICTEASTHRSIHTLESPGMDSWKVPRQRNCHRPETWHQTRQSSSGSEGVRASMRGAVKGISGTAGDCSPMRSRARSYSDCASSTPILLWQQPPSAGISLVQGSLGEPAGAEISCQRGSRNAGHHGALPTRPPLD